MTKKRPSKEHNQQRAKAHDKPIPGKRTTTAPAAETTATIDRRGKDRRNADRRGKQEPVAVERRCLERRAKVSRRRQIDPTTCERDYTPEEVEFMSALEQYKRRSGRMFPTCSEVLEVIRGLGYEKRSDFPLSQPPLSDAANFPIFTPLTDSAV